MFKVMLDAGHGLYTAGKETPPHDELQGTLGNYIKEAEQNYPIMFMVRDMLVDKGVEVLFTNDNINIDTSLVNRVELEHLYEPDVFVSFHKNASPEFNFNNIRGIETYCYIFGANGEKLARLIHNHLILDSGDKDRGVKEGNFKIIRDTYAPAVLIELGFMTNLEDAKRMLDVNWHKIYATSISKGILDYLGISYKEEVPECECVTKAFKDNMEMLIESTEANLESMRQLLKSLE